MYYLVSEIGEYFLEACFYFYFQQIKYAVANESLILCNLMKRAPYFFLGREQLFIDWKL